MSLLRFTVGMELTLAARVAVMRMTSLTIEIERRWIAMAFLVGIGGSVGALYPALRKRASGCGRSIELRVGQTFLSVTSGPQKLLRLFSHAKSLLE